MKISAIKLKSVLSQRKGLKKKKDTDVKHLGKERKLEN